MTEARQMTAEEDLRRACEIIVGRKLAGAILKDKGLSWLVVAAMAEAKTTDDPWALDTLRKHIASERAKRGASNA